jgi:uncharacterized Zn-binding protein involved in type VI secretion
MSQFVARIGDIGIGVCPNHGSPQIYTTTFNTGSAVLTADGKPVCTVGCFGTSTCGHQTTALTGSTIYKSNGLGIHRIGDIGQNYGQYTVTTGSPTVQSA